MTADDEHSAPEIPLRETYAEQLRAHALELITLGYHRLDAPSFQHAEEDEITGELVKAIKLVLHDPESPEWVERYVVQEQIPQNVAGRRGKHRPKMDIEIEHHRRGTPPRLGFEAKRLGPNHGVSNYLGEEGLLAFINGYYPTTHGEAGMLGYVQSATPAVWHQKLVTALLAAPAKYRVRTSPTLQTEASDETPFCFHHVRDSLETLLGNRHKYTDYLIIGEDGEQFSDHGDSGKRIVTANGYKPVALLWGGWKEKLRKERMQEDWT